MLHLRTRNVGRHFKYEYIKGQGNLHQTIKVITQNEKKNQGLKSSENTENSVDFDGNTIKKRL